MKIQKILICFIIHYSVEFQILDLWIINRKKFISKCDDYIAHKNNNVSGIMFPSKGDLHIAPFMDDALFMEQTNKANFW